MIDFRCLRKRFGTQEVLAGVSFALSAGEVGFLLGRSGVGKSVLLKSVVGLLRLDHGEIWVDGEEISHLPESDLLRVRAKCGLIFQNPALFDSWTVFDNVAFGLTVRPQARPVREVVGEKLRLVNLTERILDKLPGELSYGMQKRVSIARTLVLEPRVLLLDEPTTGLDPVATTAVERVLVQLARELGVTVLVVSHDMNSALKIADKICVLDAGRLAFEGTASELKQSTHPLVVNFLRDSQMV